MTLNYQTLNEQLINQLKQERQYNELEKDAYAIVYKHPVHGLSVISFKTKEAVEKRISEQIENADLTNRIVGVFKNKQPVKVNLQVNVEILD